jgi:hypothetical protein
MEEHRPMVANRFDNDGSMQNFNYIFAYYLQYMQIFYI